MYKSSIISKYGDTDNVSRDVKTLNEILSRQGSQLLIDAIAEYAGTTANKHKFRDVDRYTTIQSLVDSLKRSLQERL